MAFVEGGTVFFTRGQYVNFFKGSSYREDIQSLGRWPYPQPTRPPITCVGSTTGTYFFKHWMHLPCAWFSWILLCTFWSDGQGLYRRSIPIPNLLYPETRLWLEVLSHLMRTCQKILPCLVRRIMQQAGNVGERLVEYHQTDMGERNYAKIEESIRTYCSYRQRILDVSCISMISL